MGAYRIEISPNRRASCKSKECKDNGIKIQIGEIRFAVEYTFDDRQAWAYKHWGCVTPRQIANLKKEIENNLEYFDGYDTLPKDVQAKVRRALEVGHVSDAEWAGDVEQNRPGASGRMRSSPQKAKKPKLEAKDAGSPQGGPPPKSSTKKRGLVKDEDVEADGMQEPQQKKTKAAAKKGQKSGKAMIPSVDDVTQGLTDEEPPPTKGRGTKKKAAVKAEEDSAAPVKQEVQEDDILNDVPPQGGVPDGAEADTAMSTGNPEKDTKSKKPTKNSKKATATAQLKTEANEEKATEDVELPKPAKGRKEAAASSTAGTEPVVLRRGRSAGKI